MYYSEKLNAIIAKSLSGNTLSWLTKFIGQEDWDLYNDVKSVNLSNQLITELSPFRLQKPSTLYRGLFWPSEEDYLAAHNKFTDHIPKLNETIYYKDLGPSSWSLKLDIAKGFSQEGAFGIVLETYTHPEDTLVDTLNLPKDLKIKYLTGQEQEIVLLPKTYKTKVAYIYKER